MARHSQRDPKPKGWYPSHVSVEDGSPAMRMASTPSLITLMLRDGTVFTEPADLWRENTDG
jgi:hypothetical protein